MTRSLRCADRVLALVRNRRRVLRALAWSLAGLMLLLAVGLGIVGAYFHAAPGEWAGSLRLGDLSYRVSVEKVLRLATHPDVIALLEGRRMTTRWGVVVLGAEPDGQLVLRCSPCRVQARALSETPLRLSSVRVRVRREANELRGDVLVGGAVHATFVATLARGGLGLDLTLPPTPVREVYALFADEIPEWHRARIAGDFGARISLRMPERELHLAPTLNGFQVSGLGTEALRRRLPAVACDGALTPPSPPAVAARWLGRAVIAAEDQRFWQHTGYDLRETTLSLQRNQASDGIARGGSTLSQQLAKLLFTGDERSHVRKLRELLYAVEMEDTLGKPRILQLYLAVAPWGRGVCGGEKAARAYYGKAAATLSRAEAAWLAAMLHTPDRELGRWRRTGHPDMRRAIWVVDGMGTGPRRRREAVLLLARLAPPAAP